MAVQQHRSGTQSALADTKKRNGERGKRRYGNQKNIPKSAVKVQQENAMEKK